MESSNLNDLFAETVNLVRETLGLGASSSVSSELSFEALALVAFGTAATIAMRRYKAKLASTRTLQPSAATDLQQALRPAAMPLSAPLHTPTHAKAAVSPVSVIAGGDTSHAA